VQPTQPCAVEDPFLHASFSTQLSAALLALSGEKRRKMGFVAYFFRSSDPTL